jgi:hypothetical protein
MTSTRVNPARTEIAKQDPEEDYVIPTAEEAEEIEAALAEAELGGWISFEEVMRSAREIRAEFERKKR